MSSILTGVSSLVSAHLSLNTIRKMRKDLFDILNYAVSLGYRWGMTTNGMLINEKMFKKIEEAKENNESVSMKCEICDEIITAPVDFKLESAFNAHLKEKHSITYSKAYYDTYLKKDEKEGICPICKKPTSYRGLFKGYAKFCSNECFGASVKKDENGFSSHSSGIVAALRRSIAAITENIKTKYKRFLATENKTKLFKIGEGFNHKTVSSKEVVITPDNDKALIRTEISCNQEQKQYTGTQTRYIPKQEHCTTTTYIDDIIDDGNSMNESEWCR